MCNTLCMSMVLILLFSVHCTIEEAGFTDAISGKFTLARYAAFGLANPILC
jgi:hypothetical protein